MARHIPFAALTVIAAAVTAVPATVGAQTGAPTARTSPVKSAPEEVADAHRNLERLREMYKQGRVAASEVMAAEITLLEARLRLPARQNDTAATVADLEALAAVRENLLAVAAARHEAGVLPLREVLPARVALAEARIRLELSRIVVVREQDLAAARAAYKAGVGTASEVTKSKDALAKAHRRLSAYGAERE